MNAVLVAFIVGGLSIFGQWFLKRQDYDRLDEVAKRAEKVAKRAEVVATTLADENVHVADKLEEIHVLVNSRLTDALNEITRLREFLDANARPGDPSPPEAH